MGEHYLDTVGVRSSILLVPTRLYATLTLALAACGFKPAVGGDAGSGQAADAATGLGPDAGPSYTGKCGSPGAIHDDFTDPALDNEWRASGMTMEANGVVSVTPSSSTNFGGYITKHRVDLTGTNVEVEVPQMLDTTSFATAALYLVADPTHYVAITQLHGMLNAEWRDGGGTATDVSAPYDPAKHRWWRISEANGTVKFEVSGDGVTYAALAGSAQVTSPSWIDDVEIALGGYSDSTIAHGTVQFDNLDGKLDPAGWCKADTFSDTFQRSSVGYDWTPRFTPTTGAAGCMPSVNSGAHFDQSGIPNSRCWLASGRAYDLAGSRVYAHVPAIVNTKPGWTAFLRALSDNVTDAMLIEWDTGNLCAQIRSEIPICRPYDLASDLYWRIGEAGGTLVFDASPDAQTWTPVATVPVPFLLNALEIQVGTEATLSFAGGVSLVVSGYNETQN